MVNLYEKTLEEAQNTIETDNFFHVAFFITVLISESTALDAWFDTSIVKVRVRMTASG